MNSKYMRVKNNILLVAVLCILVVEIAAIGWWLVQYELYQPLRIEAAFDVFLNGKPVYAQFIYAQHIVVPEPHEVVSIYVPLGKPLGSAERISVALIRNGQTVFSWLDQNIPVGVSEVEFRLPEPTWLQGPFEFKFTAIDTTHDERDQAVRVFIETADANYPDGNYQIAGNAKQGDIGLRLQARRRVWQSLLKEWQSRPLNGTTKVLVVLATCLLVAVLPITLGVSGARRERRSE